MDLELELPHRDGDPSRISIEGSVKARTPCYPSSGTSWRECRG